MLDEIDQYLYLYKRVRWNELAQCVGLGEDANECINQFFDGRRSKSKHNAVMNCVSLFNRLSEEDLKPERAKVDTADENLKQLLSLYAEYLKTLSEPEPAGRVDLSLLQQRALETLKGSKESERTFKYVIIDEYQDTNPIQEKIIFHLARGNKNICVVGDDDQGLYRFRGATVENFVQFPKRCKRELGIAPKEIHLVKNYRSRSQIVSFYNRFIAEWDWSQNGDGKGKPVYRIPKMIEDMRKDNGPAVVASTPGKPDGVCPEIAELVWKLLEKKIVNDPNQIAFVFPSLKAKSVGTMIDALTARGLKVYAPRAGTFLEVPEIILIQGFPLDSNISTQLECKHNKVKIVTAQMIDHRLLACLDDKVSEDTVARLKFNAGDIFVCLDSAMTDQAKMRLANKCILRTI